MRQKDKPNSEPRAGVRSPAPDSPGTGESVCYLPLLDDDGSLTEPRHLIREYAPGAERVVDLTPGSASKGHQAAELVPHAGESLVEYCDRLERPAERTAAWKLALAAPIAIRLDGAGMDGHRAAIIDYVQRLLS